MGKLYHHDEKGFCSTMYLIFNFDNDTTYKLANYCWVVLVYLEATSSKPYCISPSLHSGVLYILLQFSSS